MSAESFFCQSQLDGIIRAHLENPWLVYVQSHSVRSVLKIILLWSNFSLTRVGIFHLKVRLL